ncbi:MAG: phosphoglycerate dehydrogenase [Verrucomicrobiae bacterium]|nr:phosphoglycerate dehydrogenase [Verrucomicrobiae bacterium]
MAPQKVLVADPIAEKGIEELRAAPGLEVDVKLGLGEAELIDLAPSYAAIIVRSGVKITAPVIEAGAGTLRAIGRAGVGVDNIDIPAATRHGVVVMNTPGGNTISTAEHAFTLMMSLARHIPRAHRSVVEGRFKEGRKGCQGVELYNKTLAILGMGRIGGEFARRAMAFGMRVVAYDPFLSESRAKMLRVELCETVDEAVAQADFITLHMPKTAETTHMIDAKRIALMKPGVRIVNCARGGLIDEAALLDGLESGQVAGAALDVYEVEPPPADFPLLGRDDVVLTPHLGASTEEAQENVGIEIARAIRDTLIDGTVVNAVNMPNIDQKTLAEIGPYLRLAEVLGRLAAQVAPKQPDVFRINYTGKVSEVDTTLITRSALKGFLEVSSGEGGVNYLNALGMAEDRGLRMTESRPVDPSEFTDLIEVIVGNEEESAAVAGTFFGSQPRIVKLRNRFVEASPEGTLLLLENSDEPGIVGAVGRILGDHGVNIASMSLSRNQVGGRALSVINLDSAPGPEVLTDLEKVKGIHEARAVVL